MGRPALISLPLVESVERYGDALADASQDGDIDPEEQRREDRRDRLYLVHCSDDPDPNPDGPGAGQKKAA